MKEFLRFSPSQLAKLSFPSTNETLCMQSHELLYSAALVYRSGMSLSKAHALIVGHLYAYPKLVNR